MKIAIVGATGLVGAEMLTVLAENKIRFDRLILVASSRSVGRKLEFGGNQYTIMDHDEAIAQKPDFAVFSAGGSVSREWAPKYTSAGTTVIDNSSAWRMDENIPLVVPEINGSALSKQDRIIANPNCSTIGLVMVLHPLHQKFGVKRVVVSTYQAVTGTGMKALIQLKNERSGQTGEMAYKHQIDLNLIPHGGDFLPSGYTTEEEKLVNETRKILSAPSIMVTATVVRVPVFVGHSESVNIEFNNDFDLPEIYDALKNMEGVVVYDNPSESRYPMPLLVQGRDEVFVGRIRRDDSQPKSLNLFLVSDNLRKGAATNAIQILQYILKNQLR
jgi:aspartate-semialdehyde dehydrogenase